MAHIANKTNPPVKLSKPYLRALDFLTPRTATPEPDAGGGDEMRIGRRSVAPLAERELSPAEYRLQQLALFRQRQLEESGTPPPPTARGRRSTRAARDAAAPNRRNWVAIGPAGVERGQAITGPVISGRTKGAAIAPGGQRVYIATANGGVWYSGDTGNTWTPLMNGLDYFPTHFGSVNPNPPGNSDSLACGAIALVAGHGNSDDLLYVGTGEGGAPDAHFGVGPLVSYNGGLSWNREDTATSGELLGKGFYTIVVDPDDPGRALGATTNGLYVRESDGAGHYHWVQKKFGGKRVSGLTVAKGKGGKRFFAAVWEDQKVYASSDGENWDLIDDHFPTNRIGRISLAANPHNPNIVYAQIAFGGPEPAEGSITEADPKNDHLHGIYRFDYGIDRKWHKIGGAPDRLFGPNLTGKAGQGDYDNAIIVAPNNENLIYIGGSGRHVGSEWVATIYRCDLTVLPNGDATTVPVHIGENVHADVHGFAFAPNDATQLWVVCDGGVFYTHRALGTGHIFESRNKGLQTLTINYLGTHPTEEEVLFCGAQDNGGLRYMGEDVWLHSLPGDGGYYLANWNDPYQIIATYARNDGFRSTTSGGNRHANGTDYDYSDWNIPLSKDAANNQEALLFYAPLAQVPQPLVLNQTDAEQQKQGRILAFGTQRPWISVDFGDSWLPIPSRNRNNDNAFIQDAGHLSGARISALAFQDSRNLLVGLEDGQIYLYKDKSANNDWSDFDPVKRLDNIPAGPLSVSKPITDFALHPANAGEFYVTLGGRIRGANQHKHVWHYDGTQWHERGGIAAGSQLLDVHFNALVAVAPNGLFAGSDVGIWKSEDGGDSWETFSFGLPETAVTDLQVSKRDLGGGQTLVLLRAATYGRGVYEYQLSPAPPAVPDPTLNVDLFLRDHILDKGRYPTRLNFKDPRNSSAQITTVATPDIKIDTPDANGLYQVRPDETLSPGSFYLNLNDRADNVPVPPDGAAAAVSKVHVQVHNRGALAAEHVFVMLLMAEAAAGLPDLPADYQLNLQNAVPIQRDGWTTIGFKTAQGMYAANPKIVTFDLPSSMLPPHASLGAGKDMVLVVLLHHPNDPYNSNNRKIDPAADNNLLLSGETKVAIKRFTAKTLGSAPPALAQRPPLNGFVDVPASATEPGAPYDAFLAAAFRQNDAVLYNVFMGALSAPLASIAESAPLENPDPKGVWVANHIVVDTVAGIESGAGIPLVWYARESIVLSNIVRAKGRGAASGADGDFGGTGGGGASSVGHPCVLPRSNPALELAAGGAQGNAPGTTVDPAWASRALLMLPFCKGGAAGGDDGTNRGGGGGGVVVLCAPVIEFADNGKIDASGSDGAANAGGGGGGLIVLIANEIRGLRDAGPDPNVLVNGGGGGGGRGGNGLVIVKRFT